MAAKTPPPLFGLLLAAGFFTPGFLRTAGVLQTDPALLDAAAGFFFLLCCLSLAIQAELDALTRA